MNELLFFRKGLFQLFDTLLAAVYQCACSLVKPKKANGNKHNENGNKKFSNWEA